MNKKILFTILVSSISHFSFAQNFDKNKLDAYFTTLEQNNKFIGSVAVSENGKIIYTKSVGFSDVENKIKASNETKYRIGSITKTFTAVLVFKAVEEGKLKLDQSIDKWFPDIKNSERITIAHLLNHRSGIHSFTSNEDYLDWHTQPKTEKDLLELIKKGGSDFNPNEKAEYSNSNYVLLTFILEKTYKKSYSELIEYYITKPLNLMHTRLAETINSKNNEAKSYQFIGNWNLEKETHPSIPLGAGAIMSTPIDIVKFSDALFNEKIINKNSLNQMKEVTDGYAYGLFKIPFYDKVGFGHTGGIDGFSSVFYHFQDGNISYALTSNGTNYSNNTISLAVLSAIYNKTYEIPTFSHYEHSEAELNDFLGTYSSSGIPLKITITKNQKTLIAQASGQPSFPLDSTDKNKFKFDQANLKIEFNSTDKTFILYQGNGKYLFVKE